jgi:hypothetical protein
VTQARNVDRVLQSKARLVKTARANHDHYTFEKHLGIGLPIILALSRGDGDVSDRNVKGLADGLGMKKEEFAKSLRCHVCGSVMHLCLAVSLTKRVAERMSLDPVVYKDGCRAMAKSVTRLLGLCDAGLKPNHSEVTILNRLDGEIDRCMLSEVSAIKKDIKRLISQMLLGS